MKPIIKWVGGKSQISRELEAIIRPLLTGDNTYWEPFTGGGAIALDMEYPKTRLNDLNSELVNMYTVIKNYPEELIRFLQQLQATHSKDQYYEVRGWDRSTSKYSVMNGTDESSQIARAARTIYLNKTCFNGLYRVNSKGQFNSPMGRTSSGKTPDIVHADEIRKMSKLLQTVSITNGSYSDIILQAKPGDVVFFDPPYDPDEDIGSDGFVGYQKEGWTKADTKALKTTCDFLVSKGISVIITNNDTEFIRQTFAGYNIKEVDVRRNVNRDATKRTGKEVIIYKTF